MANDLSLLAIILLWPSTSSSEVESFLNIAVMNASNGESIAVMNASNEKKLNQINSHIHLYSWLLSASVLKEEV